MAISDVINKKKKTSEAEGGKSEKKNIFEDVRLVIAILVVLILALIGLIAYGSSQIKETQKQISEIKVEYSNNQKAINQLLALKKQSAIYKARKDEYDEMIKSEPLDQMKIMIDIENRVEKYNCSLASVEFDETVDTGLVKQVNAYITITGGFNDIMRFCRDTVNEKQIKRIDKINITKESEDSNTMKAEITVVEFSRG